MCLNKHGFSLIEVLIALGLFSVSLTVLAFAINSVYVGLIGFESEIMVEEDLRFLRYHLPYKLSKEALLSGGKLIVPHGGNVEWKATVETSDLIIDFYTITISYVFENPKRVFTEVYQRFVKGWMDEIERSSRIQLKKEKFETDNRYQE